MIQLSPPTSPPSLIFSALRKLSKNLKGDFHVLECSWGSHQQNMKKRKKLNCLKEIFIVKWVQSGDCQIVKIYTKGEGGKNFLFTPSALLLSLNELLACHPMTVLWNLSFGGEFWRNVNDWNDFFNCLKISELCTKILNFF
jgi:hypothetical protein